MDQYFYEKPFWSCAATNNMPVGVGSGRQESPLAEGRNYIFVTFFFLHSTAQGTVGGATRPVGWSMVMLFPLEKTFSLCAGVEGKPQS